MILCRNEATLSNTTRSCQSYNAYIGPQQPVDTFCPGKVHASKVPMHSRHVLAPALFHQPSRHSCFLLPALASPGRPPGRAWAPPWLCVLVLTRLVSGGTNSPSPRSTHVSVWWYRLAGRPSVRNARQQTSRQPATCRYSNSGVRPAARSCTTVANCLPSAGVWASAAPYRRDFTNLP